MFTFGTPFARVIPLTAITFVGASTPVVAVQAPYSPNLPSGWVPNDFLLLLVQTSNETTATQSATPAGWKAVPKSSQGVGTQGGAGATMISAYWTYAVAGQTVPTFNNGGNHQYAQILAFRNVDPVYPFDAWGAVTNGTASTSVTFPTITTTVASAYVLLLLTTGASSTTAQASGWTNANLTSLTELADTATNSANGGCIAVAAGTKASAGAIGTSTATLATSSQIAGIVVALRPNGLKTPTGTPTATGTSYAEGVEFTLTAPTTIRYGTSTTYFEGVFPPGAYIVGNSLFDGGDSVPFTAKTAFVP